MNRLLLLFITLLTVAYSGMALDFEDGDFAYSIDTSTGRVTCSGFSATGAAKSLDNVTIPRWCDYDGFSYKVMEIGANAFAGCTSIIKVNTSCEKIGERAFEGCSNLAIIQLEYGVKSIGSRAFAGTAISSLNLPASLLDNSFVVNACDDCPNFRTFTVDDANNYYSAVQGVLYNKSQTNLIRVPVAKSPGYWFYESPKTLKFINSGSCANNCYSGTDKYDVEIPYGVTYIGGYAFENVSKINTLFIPGSVSTIGQYAFYNSQINYFSVSHNNPIELSTDVFYGANKNYLYVPVNTWQKYAEAKYWKDFRYIKTGGCDFYEFNEQVGEYIVTTPATDDTPGEVTMVYGTYSKFRSHPKLQATISHNGYNYNVTQLADSVFAGNTNMTELHIPKSVTNLPRWAFENCSYLKSVTFEDGYEPLVVGYRAFWGTAVRELEIPASARTIQMEAFDNMPWLEKLVFNRNLTTTVYSNAYGVTNPNPWLRVYVCWSQTNNWIDSVAKWSETPTKYLNQWVTTNDDSGYQLFSSRFYAELPEGLDAYYINQYGANSGQSGFIIVGDVAKFRAHKYYVSEFPGNYARGYVLKGTPGARYLLNTTSAFTYDSYNYLMGAPGVVRFTGDETDAAYYGLASYDEPLTFYRYLGARRGMAYVKLPYDIFKDVNYVQIIFDDRLPGDVNGDGQVNAGDISELYAIILGTDTTNAAFADINADGNINAGDVSELYSIILTK